MRKGNFFAWIAVVCACALLFAGCEKDVDTRQHMKMIGAVVTFEKNSQFEELFVFPSGADNMGGDFIGGTRGETRVGSFGVSVEKQSEYDIIVRNGKDIVYIFEKIQLMNEDIATITMGEPIQLQLQHRDGASESFEGKFIAPGDAPDITEKESDQQLQVRFTLKNDTDFIIARVFMREADAINKGEVQLHTKLLKAGKSTDVNAKLYESDKKTTEWVLYLETDRREVLAARGTFNPWTAENMTLVWSDNTLQLTTE